SASRASAHRAIAARLPGSTRCTAPSSCPARRGRRRAAARGSRAAARADAADPERDRRRASGDGVEDGELDVLDVRNRQLQEAHADCAERLWIAGGQEAVTPLTRSLVLD